MSHEVLFLDIINGLVDEMQRLQSVRDGRVCEACKSLLAKTDIRAGSLAWYRVRLLNKALSIWEEKKSTLALTAVQTRAIRGFEVAIQPNEQDIEALSENSSETLSHTPIQIERIAKKWAQMKDNPVTVWLEGINVTRRRITS